MADFGCELVRRSLRSDGGLVRTIVLTGQFLNRAGFPGGSKA